MSKKGRSNSRGKKRGDQSYTALDKSSSRSNSEENRDRSNPRRTKKNHILKFIFKNKNCISYGLHTRIFKVFTFVYKGKKFIFEY